MPGPRSEAGGGGSQVEVKAGRERLLTSRAAVDSAPGKTSGGGRLRWQAGLSMVPISGARVQGLEEATGRGVSTLGGRASTAVLATEPCSLLHSCTHCQGAGSKLGGPVNCGCVPPALGLLAPGPRGPGVVRGQGSGPRTTAYPAEACQAAGKGVSHAG